MSNLFKLLSSKKIYQNHWIKVREDKVIRPGGKEGIFGVIEMKGGCTTLAMNKRGQVYLASEYKYGIKKRSIELISGGFDRNEKPLAAAKRELREEAGLEAEKWIFLGQYYGMTTAVKSPSYLFLALGAKQTSQPNPGEGEVIEIIKLPLAKAVKMVIDCKIKHLPSCLAVLKAEKYLESANFYH